MIKTAQPRPIGRPRVRLEALEVIPTRCPETLHRYLKAIYPFQFATLTALHEEMLRQFLAVKPWNAGVEWRKPRARVTRNSSAASATGWVQINVQVPPKLKAEVEKVAKTEGVSAAAVAFTAMFWWAQFVMPPKVVQPAKDEAGSQATNIN